MTELYYFTSRKLKPLELGRLQTAMAHQFRFIAPKVFLFSKNNTNAVVFSYPIGSNSSLVERATSFVQGYLTGIDV
jgi:hypothetical protein